MTELQEIEIDGVPLVVAFEYHPGCKGSWEGGLQMEPDEPESVEIHEIWVKHIDILPVVSADVVEMIRKQLFSKGEN